MGGIVDAIFGGDNPPPPPDPYAVANAQGAANIDAARVTTALNRANQITPWGSLTWTQSGPDTWTSTITLDPRVQALLDANLATSLRLQGAIDSSLANVTSTLSQPLTAPSRIDINDIRSDVERRYADLQPLTVPDSIDINDIRSDVEGRYAALPSLMIPNSIDINDIRSDVEGRYADLQPLTVPNSIDINNIRSDVEKRYADLPSLTVPDSIDINGIRSDVEKRYTDLQPSLQGATALAMASRGDMASQLSRLRNLYSQDFNYNSAPAMPTADESTRKAVEDALYARATARLDPRFSQAQDQLISSLAAQGITQGSEAYNRELQNFNNAKNDAYSSAMNDAIAGSVEAMQRLFNMGLQARQQGVNEANTLRTLPTQEAVALAGIANALDTASRNWYGAETAQETAKDNSTVSQFNMERTNNQDRLYNTIAVRNQILNELNAKDNSTAIRFNMERTNNQDQFNNTIAAQNQILKELIAKDNSAVSQFNMERMNNQEWFNNTIAVRDQILKELLAKDTSVANQFNIARMNNQDRFNNTIAARNQTLNELIAKDNSTVSWFNMERMNNQDQLYNTIAVRNQLLNELNALRTGAQVQMPQFGNTNSGAQVAASPIAQSVYNSYQGALANYNAQVGSNNAMLGGLTTLGAAAMMAPAGTFAGLATLF